jgi:hypothetical protein
MTGSGTHAAERCRCIVQRRRWHRERRRWRTQRRRCAGEVPTPDVPPTSLARGTPSFRREPASSRAAPTSLCRPTTSPDAGSASLHSFPTSLESSPTSFRRVRTAFGGRKPWFLPKCPPGRQNCLPAAGKWSFLATGPCGQFYRASSIRSADEPIGSWKNKTGRESFDRIEFFTAFRTLCGCVACL